jgi:hypothetical protein
VNEVRQCIPLPSVLAANFGPQSTAQLTGLALLSDQSNLVENDCALGCLNVAQLGCKAFLFENSTGRCQTFGVSGNAAAVVSIPPGWMSYTRLSFDTSAFMNNGAYAQYGFNSLLPSVNDVSISVFTSSATSFVWRQGQLTTSSAPDFLGLSIIGGYPVVQFDLGSGPVELAEPSVMVNNSAWHVIRVRQSFRTVTLQVDDGVVRSATYPYADDSLSLSGAFTVGNYGPHVGSRDSLVATLAQTQPPFSGCVRGLQISSKSVALYSAATVEASVTPCPQQ